MQRLFPDWRDVRLDSATSLFMSEGTPVTEQIAKVISQQLQRPAIDRRRASFPRLFIGAIVHGRRRGPRRRGDTDSFYLDWYDERLFLAATGIFLFSCLDALFTLMLLSMGAVEVNPFMAALIDAGVEPFVYAKLLITGAGIIFLVVHSTFLIGGAVRVSHVLHALLFSYTALVLYQIGLLAHGL